ncbi:hypothetical protein [Providencia stuartii]|uniref:hypothetical protein n=1 Tax=Providencia stuartii TaxID=588 RepID=UPI001239AC35|nr:hypothetical protein [Providencia stuartii]MDT7049887.1 hypothetical protein [Providencia stuartii]NPD41904.1 hypothetical protein [Providencia stuartii]NPD93450.1 hypothetical protein [Providencia stuartii]QET96463.1 hypothetical protein FOB53_03940 [Providencia stuartii]HEM8145602.1 hypothetical protein [Providencia stuartii]
MNYQVAPFWLYSSKLTLLIIIALVISFYNVTGFILYLIFLGLIWAVLLSIKIHGLKEKGLILRNSETSTWMVYIRGIPVQEQRQHLKNPYFAIKNQGVNFIFKALSIKLFIQIFFIGLIFKQTLVVDNIYIQLVSVLASFAILWSLLQTIWALCAIKTEKMVINEFTSPSKSQWYEISFRTKKNTVKTALECILAL